jgi:hypothetical protein
MVECIFRNKQFQNEQYYLNIEALYSFFFLLDGAEAGFISE